MRCDSQSMADLCSKRHRELSVSLGSVLAIVAAVLVSVTCSYLLDQELKAGKS